MMSDESDESELVQAIKSVFYTPAEEDSCGNKANVVDGLFAIARGLDNIARSLDNLKEPAKSITSAIDRLCAQIS